MGYSELQVTSNFSFLRGGSHPEELVRQAKALGYDKIAITDHNTLAGVVRAHTAAKGYGMKIIPACRLELQDGPPLLAYPTSKEAYAGLSGLLTLGNLRTEKGDCKLFKADIYQYAKEIKFVMVPPAKLNRSFDFDPAFSKGLAEYKEAFGKDLYIAAHRGYQGNDAKMLYRIACLSDHYSVPMIATGDVYYHTPQRRQLQDVLTCIRKGRTIYNAGYLLHANAERYLKPVKEIERLYRQYPDIVSRTGEIAEGCQFSLDELKYIYPDEITACGNTLQELTRLAWEGAHTIYGQALPEKVIYNINYELKFIEEMDYAPYFLTVYDIVRFARSRGILCQGRGSAANSTICFCLGITSVDPTKFDLLFERFISSARNEPPDIDVDFEHERREEVMQYVYEKYGRDRAAIVATVTQVHHKGAIRDVAKVMGMSQDAINRLSKSIWEFSEEWQQGNRLSQMGFDPADVHLRKVLELTEQYVGFPRQLGQHTGGFVITQNKISDLCPVFNARMENRTNIEWNKDDIDALGFLKIDVLSLGMLTCIRKCFELVRDHYGKLYTLASVPQDDPKVYEMISHADTIGVFQIESRAQMSMLPRLKPRNFYDLVIEVAIVRPGPIQGDMVHPYLRRRNGEEPVEYPSQELKDILGKTMGVPLFQEQAMKVAIVAAGFTPAEADELRRSMATFKAIGKVSRFEQKLIDGMVARGYKKEYASRIFRQLEGFGSYGFPESHAASFAQLVYVSSWLKCYYPDAFATALLNSMPMGFYQPAQIVIDARKHGVTVRPVDVNHSCWDNTLEGQIGNYKAVRLGFRQISGFRSDDAQALLAARSKPFTAVHQLSKIGLGIATLAKLADADAFRSLGLNRRQALWEVLGWTELAEALFAGHAPAEETSVDLPNMSQAEHVFQDYSSLSLSLKAHPVSLIRSKLYHQSVLPANELSLWPDGTLVKVAGLVLVRQRPGTAAGVCFITLEDETGIVNLVAFKNMFTKYRAEIQRSVVLMVEGKLQREGEVTHVVVQRCFDYSPHLQEAAANNGFYDVCTPSRADEPNPDVQESYNKKRKKTKATQLEMFHEGRNFR